MAVQGGCGLGTVSPGANVKYHSLINAAHCLPWQGMPCHAVTGRGHAQVDGGESVCPCLVVAAPSSPLCPFHQRAPTDAPRITASPPSRLRHPPTCESQIPPLHSRIASLRWSAYTSSAIDKSNIFTRISFFLVSSFSSTYFDLVFLLVGLLIGFD